jgi:DNA-binding response OmpR family regulator
LPELLPISSFEGDRQMAKQMSQTEALEILFGNKKKRYTLAQLVELVAKKTKRTVTSGSITVRISTMRSDGMKITTFRGKASRAKDGKAQYQVA